MRPPVPGRPLDSEFFTTWQTMARADWRADEASGLLQIAKNPHFGFFPFAQEFHVQSKVGVARTIAKANTQHGPGGGEKLYFPRSTHRAALKPVGPLIRLGGSELDAPPATPSGSLKELFERSTAAGGEFLASDRTTLPDGGPRRRFWFTESLPLREIGQLNCPPDVRFFQDEDMHGNSCGLITTDGLQVLIAPFQQGEAPRKRSWFGKLFGR